MGGADAKIVIISRDTSSGTFECWEELVMNKERVTPAALMQASNGAVVQAVSNNKNAVGYIGLGYLDKSTKGLKVNNVQASAQTALSKQWPVARELYIFTDGQPTGEVKALVDYLEQNVKGEPAVKGNKGNCSNCRYPGCRYNGLQPDQLPDWMKKRGIKK